MVGPATVIGNEPFVYVRDGDIWHRVPSFAAVSINDDVDIGAHCSLDRGVLRDSEIGRGVKLDSHVHVGHDVIIGANSALAAGVSIGGGVTIGEACLLGGGVGIAEGLRIANRVRVTAMSMVTKSIRESGTSYSSGWPAKPSREWWRGAARLNQLAASAPSPVIEVLVDE